MVFPSTAFMHCDLEGLGHYHWFLSWLMQFVNFQDGYPVSMLCLEMLDYCCSLVFNAEFGLVLFLKKTIQKDQV